MAPKKKGKHTKAAKSVDKALPAVPAPAPEPQPRPLSPPAPLAPALGLGDADTGAGAPPSPQITQLSMLTASLDLLALPGAPAPKPPPKDAAPPSSPDAPDAAWARLRAPRILHDGGAGPRVRDVRAFLGSRFAQPPWAGDALAAEFARAEVLQMLRVFLPADTARVLWYNKSRKTSRVCPACWRLYALGDILRSPVGDKGKGREGEREGKMSPQLLQEQILSGLCSPICFLMAAFHHPDAIETVWGRMAENIDERTWAALDDVPPAANGAHALALLLKMTRLEDLGLPQLLEEHEAAYAPPEGAGDVPGSSMTRVHSVAR